MKTVIEMAREAGLHRTQHSLMSNPVKHRFSYDGYEENLERFAALVRADENKACQDVCDDVYRAWTLREDEDEIAHPDPIDCKLAIRARGDT